ncbi:sulfurtransferase [Pandoraea thiooxydans]|nr:sulfurtransferase [Pandoraea thiooxydans]
MDYFDFFGWFVKFFADYSNLVLIAIALISGGLLAWPVLSRRGRGVSIIEATQLINRRHALILDVRTDEEFSGGHLPQAKHVPLEELEKKAGQMAKNKTTPVLLVCRSGQRSAKALAILRQLGYAEAFSLQGGVEAWQQAGLPIVK